MATSTAAAVVASNAHAQRVPSSPLGTGKRSLRTYHIDHSDENELGSRMAPHETHLLEQTVFKKQANDGRWLPRRVALTDTAIHIGRDGDAHHEIIDSIPLDEVTNVEIISHHDGLGKQEVSAGKAGMVSLSSWHGTKSAASETSASEEVDQAESRNPSSSVTPRALGNGSAGIKRRDSLTGKTIFRVSTVEGGFNGGTHFVFETSDAELCSEWVLKIQGAVKEAVTRKRNANMLTHARSACNDFLDSRPVEITVVILISINFILNVLEAQIVLEEGSVGDITFMWFDIILTILFSIELAINLFANWLLPFLADGWSVFDLLVIVFSWIAIAASSVGLSTLRVVRVFRALKLVGRVKDLRKIIDAIGASIGPVLNALLICLIVNAIFAICAVQFFRSKSETQFGTFARAIYTLFLMAAGYQHPFAGELAVYEEETGEWDLGLAIFFLSYVVISIWTLLQVIMAVLLDNFVAASAQIRQEEIEKENANFKLEDHPLDPLLEELTKQYHTAVDLNERLFQLFLRLDLDGVGQIGYEDLREGLNRLDFVGSYKLSKEEWDSIVEGHCSDDHKLTPPQFIKVMRRQLKIHVQKDIANASVTCPDDFQRATLLALKLSLTNESTTTRDFSLNSIENGGTGKPIRDGDQWKWANGLYGDSEQPVNNSKRPLVGEAWTDVAPKEAGNGCVGAPIVASEDSDGTTCEATQEDATLKEMIRQLAVSMASMNARLVRIEARQSNCKCLTSGCAEGTTEQSCKPVHAEVEADTVFWDLFGTKSEGAIGPDHVSPVLPHQTHGRPTLWDF